MFERIRKEHHFRIDDPLNWNDRDGTQTHNLDCESLFKSVKERRPGWKEKAIRNDIDSINYINILRKGNYREKFGGKHKLPIFVTTNAPLVSDVRRYVREDTDSSMRWNMSALPIITDSMLLSRLWLPKAHLNPDIPILKLARDAKTAQQADSLFFVKLRETAKKLKETHNTDILDLSELRNEQLEAILIQKTKGDPEALDPDLVAASIEDIINEEQLAHRQENDKLRREIRAHEEEKKDILAERDLLRTRIIQSAASRYINKLGLSRACVLLAEYWWALITVIFGLLALGLSQIQSIPVVSGSWILCVAFVVGNYLIKVLEKWFNKPIITSRLTRKAISYCYKKW